MYLAGSQLPRIPCLPKIFDRCIKRKPDREDKEGTPERCLGVLLVL